MHDKDVEDAAYVSSKLLAQICKFVSELYRYYKVIARF